jgi:prefoldin subunit 5
VERRREAPVQNLKQFAEIQASLRRIAAEAARLAEKIEHIKKQLGQVAAMSRGHSR